MKVLIIDPWCSSQYEVYTIGLCEGLAKYVDLTLCCGSPEDRDTNEYKIKPLFFKLSNKMQRGFLRQFIRGIEYIWSYIMILFIIKKGRFDVIHVEWALFYPIDNFFLKLIKKNKVKLIYTAHNVLAHHDGEREIKSLRKLHQFFDVILVHGEKLRDEFLHYFPEDIDKVKIQRHGVHLTQKTTFDINKVSKQIVNFVEKKDSHIVTFAGVIFYNKGADRLIEYWKQEKSGSGDLLIVAGYLDQPYDELSKLMDYANACDNILYYPHYLNDDEFAYILSKSDIITIPYRHASMSGLVYSAAAFSKALIYTDTGVISEYVGDTCGIKVDNCYASIREGLSTMLNMSDSELHDMGLKLNNWIYSNYSWSSIGKRLYMEIYK